MFPRLSAALRRGSQALLYTSGLALLGAAVGSNLKSNLTGAHEAVDVALQIAMTVSLEVGLAVALHFVSASLCRGSVSKALAMAPVVALLGAGAVAGSAGYVYERHAQAVEARNAVHAASLRLEADRILASDAGASVRNLRSQLAPLVDLRPTAIIRADAQDCQRRGCDRWRDFRDQERRAEQRDALAGQLKAAEAALPKPEVRTVRDPAAEMILRVFPGAGDVDTVALRLALLWLAVLQLGPALCFGAVPLVAPAPVPGDRVAQPEVAPPAPPENTGVAGNVADTRAPPPRHPQTPHLSPVAARVVAKVRAAGGKMELGQRAMARGVGIDRRSMMRGARAAAASGVLTICPGQTGTVFELRES